MPGLGSYLQRTRRMRATSRATFLGLGTLIAIIVLLDQLFWRPLVAWSDRFKFEQSSRRRCADVTSRRAAAGSALVGSDESTLLAAGVESASTALGRRRAIARASPSPTRTGGAAGASPCGLCVGVLLAAVLWGIVGTIRELSGLTGSAWRLVGVSAAATFARTAVALAIAAAWTIPVGVAIGFNPRWSFRAAAHRPDRASVPANTVFPILLLVMLSIPGGLDIASVLLMLLGTQWYVLFNVIAGAMAIPSDLREAAVVYQVSGWRSGGARSFCRRFFRTWSPG